MSKTYEDFYAEALDEIFRDGIGNEHDAGLHEGNPHPSCRECEIAAEDEAEEETR